MPLFIYTSLELKLTFVFSCTHTPFLAHVSYWLRKSRTLEEVIVEKVFLECLRHIVSETCPQTAASSSPGPHTLSIIIPS